MARNIHWKTDRDGKTVGYWYAIPWGYAGAASPTDPPTVFYFFKGNSTHADVEREVVKHQGDTGGMAAAKTHLEEQSFNPLQDAGGFLDKLGTGGGGNRGTGQDLSGNAGAAAASGRSGAGDGRLGPGDKKDPGSQSSGKQPPGDGSGAEAGTGEGEGAGRRDWRGHRETPLQDASSNLEDAQEDLQAKLKNLAKKSEEAGELASRAEELQRSLRKLGIKQKDLGKAIAALRNLMSLAKALKTQLDQVPATLDNLRKLYRYGLDLSGAAGRPGAQVGASSRYPSTGGDPVSLFSGAFNLVQTDVSLPGRRFPLSLTRFYSNQIYCVGSFGPKWTTWLDGGVRVLPNGNAYVWMGDGTGDFFLRSDDGSFDMPRGSHWALSIERGRYRLTNAEGDVQLFDAAGRAQRYQDRFKNWVEVRRDGSGRPTELASSDGRTLQLTVDAGRITAVSDPLGRTWRYQYDPRGDLASVILPATDTLPSGRKTVYEYEHASDPRQRHLLKRIRDHNGDLALENIYGVSPADFNRVVEQELADHSLRLRYETASPPMQDDPQNRNRMSHRTLLTTVGGVTLVHEYNVWGMLLCKKLRPGGRQSDRELIRFTYDEQGNRSSINYPRGNGIEIDYDTGNPERLRRRNITEMRRLSVDGRTSHRTRLSYGPYNQIAAIERPDGARIESTLSPLGLVEKTTMPPTATVDGGTAALELSMAYNGYGQPISARDGSGREAVLDYYTAGRGRGLLKSRRVDGDIVSHHQYDAAGRLIAQRDDTGLTTHLEYDSLDQLRSLRAPSSVGQEIRFDYDPLGLLTRQRMRSLDTRGKPESPEWIDSEYRHDAHGRLTEQREMVETDLFAVTRFRYDADDNLLERVDPGGLVTRLAYDELGLVTALTLAPGVRRNGRESVTRFRYDANGNLIEQTDPLGHKSSIAYDGFDRAISETDALGAKTDFAWDSMDRLVSLGSRDADAKQREMLTWTYDALGRITETKQRIFDPDGKPGPWLIAQRLYDKAGRLAASVDPLGNRTTFEYDARGWLQRRIDAMGNITQWRRDARGLVTERLQDLADPTSPTQRRMFLQRFGYDRLGRMTSREDGLGNLESLEYDSLDRLRARTLPDGAQERFEYDLAGRMLSYALHGSGSTASTAEATVEYAHDMAGRVTQISDPRGKTYRYQYDDFGLPKSLHLPDGTLHSSIRYDATGSPIRITDARGVVETLRYDTRHRPVERKLTLKGGAEGIRREQYAYDHYGNIVTASNDGHQVTRRMDSLGRLHRETVDGKTLEIHYGANRLAEQLTYPSGFKLRYGWDAHGRLSRLDPVWPAGGISVPGRGAAGPLVQIEYLGASTPIRQTAQNGLTRTSGYDAAGRLLSLEIGHGTGQWAERIYTLRDGRGRVSAMLRSGMHASAYEYDAQGQLTAVREDAAVTEPDLSPWSASTRSTAPQAGKSQRELDLLVQSLLPRGSARREIRYAHDEGGNRSQVVTKEGGTDTSVEYRVDDANRYTHIDGGPMRYDAAGNLIDDGRFRYFYDYLNRLVRMREAASGRDLLLRSFDPFGRATAITENGAQRHLTYQGLNAIEETDDQGSLQSYSVYGPGIDDLLARFHSSTHFPISDGSGSAVAWSDAAGKIVERHHLDPYGGLLGIADEGFQPLGPASQSIGVVFQGRPTLGTAGLRDFRARTYSSELGRFLQTDPIGLDGGLNLYRFARNDPLSYADPMGTDPVQRGMVGGGAGDPMLNYRSGWTNFWLGTFEGFLMAGAPFLVMATAIGGMQGTGLTAAVHGRRGWLDLGSELWQLHNMINPLVGVPLAMYHAITTDDDRSRGNFVGGLLGGLLIMSGGRPGALINTMRTSVRDVPDIGYNTHPLCSPRPPQPTPRPPVQLTLEEIYNRGQYVRRGDKPFWVDYPDERIPSLQKALDAGRNSEIAIIGKDNNKTAPQAIVNQFTRARSRMQRAKMNVTSIVEMRESQIGQAWSPHANIAWMEGIVQARSIVVLPHELDWFMHIPADITARIPFAVHELHFFLSRGYTVQRSTLFGRYVLVPPP